MPYDCREGEDDFGDSKSPIREQKPPVASDGPDCWLLVLADMSERRKLGIERYGHPVRPENGRDPFVDAYQEALDLVVYLRQEIERRKRVDERTKPSPDAASDQGDESFDGAGGLG